LEAQVAIVLFLPSVLYAMYIFTKKNWGRGVIIMDRMEGAPMIEDNELY